MVAVPGTELNDGDDLQRVVELALIKWVREDTQERRKSSAADSHPETSALRTSRFVSRTQRRPYDDAPPPARGLNERAYSAIDIGGDPKRLR